MRESEQVRKSADNIYIQLEGMIGRATIYDNKTKLLRDYANSCKIKQISAYLIAVGNYLEDNKCFKYEKGGVLISGSINKQELYIALIAYCDRQDRTRPVTKTKIKRQVFKQNCLQPEKNLIPVFEVFKKLTIEQKLETCSFNDISKVLTWVRQFDGVEVKAFVKTEL